MTAETLRIALAQRRPYPIDGSMEGFAREVAETLAAHPGTELLVYPEMHLCGTEHLPEEARPAALRAAAVALDDEYVTRLGAIAAEHGIWFCPGSIGEIGEDGEFYNTQLLFDPSGTLHASYRKMFPWRPFEPHRPGDRFIVEGLNHAETSQGTVGLSICYDAWFPEHARQLGWLGADLVLNIVKTTSPDREQELVLARANAIVNQYVVASLNAAEPVGRGRSIVVGPEGFVLAEGGLGEETLTFTFDPAAVAAVREHGTMGSNRMWAQFHEGDPTIELPMYRGRIDPLHWSPQTPNAGAQ
ncbi:carbon-nitrogen hydrolase family protein [Mycetocola saprophilus]|uniref:carbon-nitrogen hydrolase family protein n=1 Tax=Mycetocola saprophilus TaxID=76636 RepID=UPI003BF0277D